jgi:DNA polymerase
VATFAFLDAETLSRLDLTIVGAKKYAEHHSTDVLIWSYALDDAPGQLWSPPWAWAGKPDAEPTALLDHIENGGYLVAWNSFFDRNIYNAIMPRLYGWPEIKLEQWLCAQAQGEANNLPGALGKACETLGTDYKKKKSGAALIQLLSVDMDRRKFAPVALREKMGEYRAYGLYDTLAMRDVWQYTRPLTAPEWAEFHASERINDRGVAVDYEFAAAAAKFASAEQAELDAELEQLLLAAHEILPDTARNANGDLFGPVFSVNNHKRKALWLHEWLWRDEELQGVVWRPPKKTDGPDRYSCDRPTREAVLDLLAVPEHAELFEPEHAARIEQFLEIIEAGNSAAVRKFAAIANHEHGGRVHGMYSFNGAGQTGRYSSRGIQTHNMIRAPLDPANSDRALDAIDDILAGAPAETLRTLYDLPVSRLLARLIRPTFVAGPGKTLVWGDWGQIEGRVMPWLADSPLAARKVELYASGAPVYELAAMPVYGHTHPSQVSKSERQVGKVQELALQFGGAVGALTSMGRGYGVTIPEDDKQRIVDTWRINNPWARAYWSELWTAAISAFKNPGTWYAAGRVKYGYLPALMRGTLVCELPCGRWLVYPQFKHEKYIELDDKGREVTRVRTTFIKGFGSGAARVELWYGVLAENNTQATAASLLRETLYILEDEFYTFNTLRTVLHTHDEIVAECDTRDVAEAKRVLKKEMLAKSDWAEGLPLAVEIESGPYYTK